jgi:hypothetical protein
VAIEAGQAQGRAAETATDFSADENAGHRYAAGAGVSAPPNGVEARER